jgi:hypothetical protein
MAKRKQSTFERLMSGKLNRKQRKELGRRLYSDHPGLEVVHRNAAGMDVGNESHYVAVPPGCDPEPVREFGMAAHLARLTCRMLTRVQAWVDRGAQDYQARREQREKLSLQRKASALGFRLVPAA